MTLPAKRVLLINPNSSAATTRMMVTICRAIAPPWLTLDEATATTGPAMILDGVALANAVPEVVRIGLAQASSYDGIMVAAYGDPGADALGQSLAIPIMGIGQASMEEAAEGGRRFGLATVTPGLVAAMDGRAAALGLGPLYGGVRLTRGDPLDLTADPARLVEALAEAIGDCIRLDGAEAVVIGGGPLAQAAETLQGRFDVPIIAPLPAATRRLAQILSAPLRP